MNVLPAIDLLGGRCVRLRQGDYTQETSYSDDPVSVAQRWERDGATYLHLVDLDGAKAGRPVNMATVGAIARAVTIPCELGGGLRDRKSIEQAFAMGVERAVVGTRALRDPQWFAQVADAFPGRIALGLDANQGRIAVSGWMDVSDWTASEVVTRYEELPLAAVIYTDICRDGTLMGPNFDATCELAQRTRHAVIASGGIATEDDVLELARRGIPACILGRSLYEGTVILSDLVRRLKSMAGDSRA